MFGISEKGFKRKMYSDIEQDIFTRARDLFGEDINLSERSPLGLFFRTISWSLSLLWQLAEKVYFQGHLRDAEGINLDYVCEKADIYRFPAMASYGYAKFTGTPGKKIYKGFLVKTVQGVVFKTSSECIIGEDGSISTLVRCMESGSLGNIDTSSLRIIINPELDIVSVTNEERFTTGRDVETDDELRERYKLSFTGSGKATIDAIRAHLLKIPTLRGLKISENDSMQTVNGMVPKSIKIIALGGSDEEVAQAILDSKAAGIATNGNVSFMATDNIGEKHLIKFSRATELPIFVKANLKFKKDVRNKETLVVQVQSKIIKYINSIPMGNDIFLAILVSNVVCNEPYIEDIAITIGRTSESLNSSNISIEDEEVPYTDTDKVVIVYEP